MSIRALNIRKQTGGFLRKSFFAGVCALLLSACSVKKYMPEEELLYTGADIEVQVPDSLKEGIKDLGSIKTELEGVLKPKPNSKSLGVHWGLLAHYKVQREKPGFINKFLNKKIGEKPVYASDVKTSRTEDIIRNRLENRGFFYSNVTSELQKYKDKREAQAFYTVRLAQPYLMENYVVDPDTVPVVKDIEQNLGGTRIRSGSRFDLGMLKAERERLDKVVKGKGYYNFSPGFLIFEADTNQYKNKKFDLFLRLKKDVPPKATVPYRIEQVTIYPNYVAQDTINRDTVKLDNKDFIQGEDFFKPKRLDPFVLIKKGQQYNPDVSRNTSRRLTSIGTYKFVNIRYDEIDSLATDSTGALAASIYLSPMNKRSLRAELQGVAKSNNFVGPNLALTVTNRNLFNGGEILNITATAGYEMQIAGGDQAGLNSLQLGLKTDLIFPRMLFPIRIQDDWFKYAIPKTKISLGVDYLKRSKLYSLTSVSSTFGYIWDANRYVTHEFNPVSLNYVNLGNTTPEFEKILADNPFLQSSFNQQFIAGLTYSFTYNGMVDVYNRHQFFFNSTFDIAGNLIDLFSGGNERPRTFLGLEYSQYAKADVDIRYHFRLNGEQKIATRFFAGLGVPYGNSDIMPYSKLFFSGGPYSVRAFRIRSLGPGTFNPEDSGAGSFFDQTGNLRLEFNVEYRFPIISYLKGALFADAGNVWNTTENDALPGGKFSGSFIKELGVGAGAGMRLDIQGFVIRLDLAAPLSKPWLPEGKRWKFDYENPVVNFAIGYPF
ncbi:BamA/TamA family outer membrane protein [Sinomicrobium weinanense]|uniref:BamA/TamA family outer membrane protein n=1 Tax=Sinomicrobium weinanense TaxID=2842200 RepID=A0A926JW62_9FLAO|nr:BamA/TamA family outer membrane protein [Sinomicrobium weinanense]MBC9798434.1 BamA/TamA family outer membrane protein [Sinomicrobium weinanense]MBU3122493.1 outer membrane protein assembly factor [Sinomicrobium weinanense]